MDQQSLPFWLALVLIPNVWPKRILQWVGHFVTPENLFAAKENELRQIGLTEKQLSCIRQPDWATVEKTLRWAEQDQHYILTHHDSQFPHLLKEIADPPLLLFVSGNASRLQEKQIAIVGARQASINGMRIAQSFAETLSQAGLVITSGLARGIDAASHQAVLATGRTVSVFGTGLACVYPKAHRKLAERIVEKGGALVSEFPLDTLPLASHFPRRNRVIVGMSLGVLVVEAAIKSGSLITAQIAANEGREVFAIPGHIQNLLAKGCHHLIKQGAKLVESPTDILEEFQFSFSHLMSKSLKTEHVTSLSAEEIKILTQIDYEITPVDMILLRSQLTGSELSAILLALELKGYIQTASGGYIRVVDHCSNNL